MPDGNLQSWKRQCRASYNFPWRSQWFTSGTIYQCFGPRRPVTSPALGHLQPTLIIGLVGTVLYMSGYSIPIANTLL